MTKNAIRYTKENQLITNKVTATDIHKCMKMIYHDLGYRRKNSLLHTFRLINLMQDNNGYILGTLFLSIVHTKKELPSLLKKRYKNVIQNIKVEKEEQKAYKALINNVNRTITNATRESMKHGIDIADDMNLVYDNMTNELFRRIKNNYSVRYDTNRARVLKHEIKFVKSDKFQNTKSYLFTFIPRNSNSSDDPTLIKPYHEYKNEMNYQMKFNGYSYAKAKKVTKSLMYKSDNDIDFRPTLIMDLKHSFKDWFKYEY